MRSQESRIALPSGLLHKAREIWILDRQVSCMKMMIQAVMKTISIKCLIRKVDNHYKHRVGEWLSLTALHLAIQMLKYPRRRLKHTKMKMTTGMI